MTDNEVTGEKTFSEELPYFKEQMKDAFERLTNSDGHIDVVHISLLIDTKRILRKAEEEINRQQAENINLKGHLEQLKSRYDNAKSEIKRLKGISVSPSKDSMDFCGVLCDYAEELIDKAKSEAYKEFAEKLKEKAMQKFDWNEYVEVDDIDNLLKEIIEENK